LALIAFGILVSSLAVRNAIVRYALVGMNLVVIIATQARGSLLASLIAIVIHSFLSQKLGYRRRAVLIFIFLGALSLGGFLLYQEKMETSIANLLFLNDKYRGVGTGFTGRIEAWQEAYQLFADHPVLGIGFRMHEHYMGSLSSAHNGYLSMLAETGALGIACAGALTIVCVIRLLRMSINGDVIAVTGISLVAGYLFLAVFERFFINVGNPTSILVWLCLFMPARARPRRPEVASGTDVTTPTDPLTSFAVR
jgi:O-antigen ligase